MNSYTAQTKMLCRALPLLAKWFEEYDAQGSEWAVVSWQNVRPGNVVLDRINFLTRLQLSGMSIPNQFSSRTQALRKSEEICRHMPRRSEDAHKGVWTWQEAENVCYQSVFPLAAKLQITQKSAPQPSITPPFKQPVPSANVTIQPVKETPQGTIQHSQSQNLNVKQNSNVANVDFTRTLFKSKQEGDFFQALRQVFPRYDVYPNVALSCLIDFDGISLELSAEEKRFFFMGIVDCVVFDQFRSYRPLFFFELDSAYHDTPEQQVKDRYKDRILAVAGQKLYRVRSVNRPVGIDGFVTMIREVFKES